MELGTRCRCLLVLGRLGSTRVNQRGAWEAEEGLPDLKVSAHFNRGPGEQLWGRLVIRGAKMPQVWTDVSRAGSAPAVLDGVLPGCPPLPAE